MSKSFRVIVQAIENNEVVLESTVIKGDLFGLGKFSAQTKVTVIPAKAGIQLLNDSCNLAQGDSGREMVGAIYFSPRTNLGFSLELTEQIDIIKGVQDHVLNEKIAILNEEKESCPCCKGKLIKAGNQSSNFHDVFN